MAEDVFGIVGSVIAGAYRVDAVVAEGGFGVVYRAFHSGFRAPVALKCLKIPEQFSPKHQEMFLEQFRAEAELLFRLSASIPTVVRPLHVDALTTQDGRFMPFMALEWLEGTDLDKIMSQRKKDGLPALSLKKLVRMLTPVARALERAHNFSGPEGPISIVHRDLKPENIFVAQVAGEEVVKILDFGIGKAKSVASQVAGRASQSSSGLASFTPAYGAPEQWLPKRFGQTGPWTDVWGLALSIVEIACARPIVDGDQAAMMGTTLDPHRRPTPRVEGLDVTDAVEAVFQRALALDPRERYADAGLFWNALLDAYGWDESGAPSVARPAIPDLVAPAPAAARAAPAASGRRFGDDIELDSSGGGPALDLDLPEAERVQPPSPVATPAAALRSGGSGQWAAPGAERSGGSGQWASPAASQRSGGSGQWASPVGHDPAPASGPGGQRARSSAAMRAVSAPLSSGSSGAGWAAVDAPPASNPTPDAGPKASPSPAPDARSGLAGLRLPASSAVLAAPPESTLVQRLRPAVALIAVSIAVTVADQIYASSAGQVFSLGPIRAGWIAGPLLVAGIGWLVVRVLPR